jgi:hypothetical protein
LISPQLAARGYIEAPIVAPIPSPGYVAKLIEGKACEFCGSTENLYVCDWPVLKYTRTTYGKLKPGDKVKRICDKRPERSPAEVLECEPATFHIGAVEVFYNTRYARTHVVLKIGKRTKEFDVYLRSPVRVLRDSNCERVCCELCRAERGPGGTCCRQHWLSWEGAVS